MTPTNGTILVADDEPANRKVLQDILKAGGYTVYLAEDGAEALQYCAEIEFDTLLLDIMMPNMTGYEVCRYLRANQQTEHLPIIMITALAERHDRLEAMEAGANDFLTKPIDIQDILFRVRNTVRLKRLSDEAKENYRRLKETEKARDEMTAMMVHDMRNPLIGITGNLEIVQMEGRLVEEDAECIEQARRCASDLVHMVNSLVDLNRLENGKMPLELQDANISDIVETAIHSLGARGRLVRITQDIPAYEASHCDSGIMSRVIANLISNAIDFVPVDTGHIQVIVRETGDYLKLSVIDNGPGIPKADQPRIFNKFVQTAQSKRNGRPSAGLGLAFCKMAVDAHGGSIKLHSEEGQGCHFEILLPRAAAMRIAA